MWTEAQKDELVALMRGAEEPYVRRKATALWNVGRGRSQGEVADFLGVGIRSVNRWVATFRREGGSGLRVKPGRGRRCRADRDEVCRYLKQTPQNFGLQQTRWTLKALAETVPSLRGYTDAGVFYVLKRYGVAYKRGQPTLHSPDPLYDEKRAG